MKTNTLSTIFTSLAMTTFVVASVIQPAVAADPTPSSPPTVTTTPDIAKNPTALKELIGKQGARMGQGMTRLERDKTPQTPTSDAPAPTPISSTVTPTPTASPTSSGTVTPQSVVTSPLGVQGLDVSGWQTSVNWAAQKSMGARFAYVKATEGTTFVSTSFASQYSGAYGAGLIRGAYHFAIPSVSSGSAQADYFVNHGGGWSADGKTMPPLLDIEYNPYSSLGNICYNMSAADMVSWIHDFSNRMITRTGRAPAIYSTTDWWKTCTGNSAGFTGNPLHLANYASVVAALPASWQFFSVWQYTSTGAFAGDSNVWNGTEASLSSFATHANPSVPVPVPPVGIVNPSAIAVKVASLNGALGAATSGEIYGLGYGGGKQCFQLGCVVWSPSTGAHVSKGGIRTLWASIRYENGDLGYPTTDEVTGLKNGGVYQSYQGGTIYWSSASGAHISVGAIRNAWASTGYENGPLGYPTSNEITDSRGGVYQSYQGGTIIYAPGFGAFISWGAIRGEWGVTGYEKGVLGYPTSNEVTGLKNGGVYQNYEGGAIIYSPATGAHESIGGIRTAWASTGYENGRLGYPTSDEYVTSPGHVTQNYQGGTISWGPAGSSIVYK